jgi:formate hydrogenlyase subunit 3/multisubunit Na+/H+ antiporter MnhD subunit
MVLVILIISSCIITYSERYLKSDQTQGRFLGQINLVVASVLMLMLSGNLFTAFIAWQLIGISLYVLLNHYHYDLKANKAAKKKFIINRVGDLCFLIALVLIYHNNSSSLFSQLHLLNHSFIVPLLIFIAVMTKTAQFPFHMWLPDTLETPTPVSALMHAGIINAGGFLLIRCSPMLHGNTVILSIIMVVGAVTAVLGNLYMREQNTTKKQLAYSTMAQMGYMIFQCGTGLFVAALFHLIAHGFFKGYLFLNSGSTLKISRKQLVKHDPLKIISCTFFLSFLIVSSACFIWHSFIVELPLLFVGFIFITTAQFMFSVLSQGTDSVRLLFISVLVGLLISLYFVSLHYLSTYISLDIFWIKSMLAQCLLILLLVSSQIYSFCSLRKLNPENIRSSRYSYVEMICRIGLLDPIRILGEKINIRLSYLKNVKHYILAFLIVFVFDVSVLILHHFIDDISFVKTILMLYFVVVAVLSLIIANRARSIKKVLFWISIVQLSFVSILFFEVNRVLIVFGAFYVLNTLLILTTLYFLLTGKANMNSKENLAQKNTLSWPLLYLSTSLLLLIGIPGTASFVSEIYLFKLFLLQSPILYVSYAMAMLLLAVVLMHALQLHVFRLSHSTISHLYVTPVTHIFFIIMLVFNITSGVMPNHVLHWISIIL